jgi:hypothetical protein
LIALDTTLISARSELGALNQQIADVVVERDAIQRQIDRFRGTRMAVPAPVPNRRAG